MKFSKQIEVLMKVPNKFKLQDNLMNLKNNFMMKNIQINYQIQK
jgi:hypothetical protein